MPTLAPVSPAATHSADDNSDQPTLRNISRSLNPFDEDRLNNCADYRQQWDVPSLNANASAWLIERVREVKASPDAMAARKIAVLLAQAGYGKTHLFGRVADALGRDVVFAFVEPILEAQLEHPMQHIRWEVVETIFSPPPGEQAAWITQILARLCQPSFQSYFDFLPDTLRTRHSSLRQLLADDPLTAAMEILSPAGELAPYQQLGASLADAFPNLQADVVRALALGWSPAALEARRWLRGDDVPEAECKRLGLGVDSPDAERVIEAIATLLRRLSVPLVICCDQLEAVLKQPDVGPIQLSNGLVGLLQTVPNLLIVLGCLQDSWTTVLQKNVHQMFIHRTYEPIKLQTPTQEQAIDLVRRRVEYWDGNADKGGTSPIRTASIIAYLSRGPLPPRALLQACKVAIDRWQIKRDGEIDIGADQVVPQFPDVFVQHWNNELEKIRAKNKNPDDVQEAGLFQSVHDAVRIAAMANHLPPGMQLVGIKEQVVTPARNDPRHSLAITLSVGARQFSVVVTVSKRDSGVAFGSFISAVETALKAKNVAGGVLIRPFAQVGVGEGTLARKTYESLVTAGKLRVFPLEQERLTFDQLECLLSVLTDADDGLPLGSKNLSRQDCEELLAETGLLKSLRLFDFIFGNWTQAGVAPAASTPAATPTAPPPVQPSPNLFTQPVAASQTPPPIPNKAVPAPKPAAASEPAKPAPASASAGQAWAESLLANLVEKLKIWSLPVRPLGVQIGPTFARLKVQPEDRTDINKVRNKAETMRVNLGLADRPMIGFQPGFVSIDVRRPDRQTVPLLPLLEPWPTKFQGQTAFPVGLDVAGEAHWLNLADSANPHLLIAGTTGSGKSEFLKVILASLAKHLTPEQLQFILIDPKRVTFNLSGSSPYLRHPIVYEGFEAMPLIQECVDEMERRYMVLAEQRKSNVSELTGKDAVPRLVLIFDEFADLMADKAAKKELEPMLQRLGAKARAAGIHLVLGTQRTEASVVTPLLRSNLPGRISLKVTGDKDSALILDAPGAGDLLGKGDLLWRQGGDLLRLQSPFVTNDELEKLLRVQ